MPNTNETPYGYCECGCGQKTRIAEYSNTKQGRIKGEPVRFRSGHNGHTITAPEELFWKYVNKTESCWLWTGSKDGGGYGQFKIAGKSNKAHRFSYELHVGPIPPGIFVLHNCPNGDNPACCNPAHLWLGTSQDNAIDRERKGRGRDSRGEKQGSTKLVENTVRQMFLDFKSGMSKQEIADKHGITDTHVGRILRGEKWAHLHLADDAENTAYRENKGRYNPARGEKSGKAKLTEAKVRQIFKDRETMTLQAIGDKFGVSNQTIDGVLKKRYWAWLWN